MNIQIKKILIEVIKSSYPKSGRPSSKEIEHYLDVILYVLNSDIKCNVINLNEIVTCITLFTMLGIVNKCYNQNNYS